MGGTAADCLIFDSGTSMMNYVSNASNMPVDGGLCVYNEVSCESYHQNFTMRASDWLKVNNFLKSAGLDLLFDLNVLLRKGGNWDPSNAIELIQFSKRNNLNLSWQLGNEPNSFQHVFNRNISGAQLGRDFVQLRAILNDIYKNKEGLVVGPDITQPRHLSFNSLAFLEDFLEEINTSGERVIDAVTWHQYYISGKEAELKDFFDLTYYNIFAEEIKLVKNIVLENSSHKLPIWITETSDAYGGGAPNFTDRFVGGFLWLDKLGLAAYHGIQIDYWLSLLHKKLVGNRVLKAQIGIHETNNRNSANENVKKLRFYCHCAPSKLSAPNESAVTIFGMNLGLETANIVVKGLENAIYRDTYLLQGEYGVQSRLRDERHEYQITTSRHLPKVHYSALAIVIVLPLGSSNRSMVLMSMIIESPHIIINPNSMVTKRPDRIGAVKK
ncbi:hypothetical protein J437_LFUL014772 [Ladona fulva]|uniref:Uncharacterized protein n=1 Tax=Ladona fulva TaxID=123851 RepID=A0A8K0KFI6_LADFU|nr:hypothetical protein J437_LFUL014772 [Ladona fulva]